MTHREAARRPMSAVRRRSLQMVKKCVLSALRGKPVSVFVYGSVARRDLRPGSDIDIAVLPRTRWDDVVLSLLRDRIEELPIPYKVDLVNLAQASKRFRESVLREAVVWKR